MRRHIYLAGAALVMLVAQSTRASCPANAQITVVFGNGIGTTLDEAQNSLDTILAPAILQTLPPTVDPSCLSFTLAYDSQFVDSNNNVVSTANMLAQIADAGVQLGIDFAANFWSYWYVQPPAWFQTLQQQLILSATSVFQKDLLTQEALYNAELAAGHRIIVVAHSQGNLYANQAFELVTVSGGSNQMHLVAVATPASSVAGSGPYFTLHGDVITLVPGSLPPNITNDAPSPCGGLLSSVACHAFDTSYMDVKNGDNTRPAIVNAVLSFLQRPVTFGYSFQGTFQVVDPATNTFSPGTLQWQFHVPSILTTATTIASFDSSSASGALSGCSISTLVLSPSTSPPTTIANFAALCGPGNIYIGAYTQFSQPFTSPGIYPGYTRAGVFEGNLQIQQAQAPSATFLSFIEGNPGVPGDGVFINAGGPFNVTFNLSTPFPLSGVTDGITVTVFLLPSIQNFQSLQLDLAKADGSCSSGLGAGTSATVSFNGVTGFSNSIPQSALDFAVNAINHSEPGCTVTLNDLRITGLVVFASVGQIVTTLDAAAINLGQNAFPSTSIQ